MGSVSKDRVHHTQPLLPRLSRRSVSEQRVPKHCNCNYIVIRYFLQVAKPFKDTDLYLQGLLQPFLQKLQSVVRNNKVIADLF